MTQNAKTTNLLTRSVEPSIYEIYTPSPIDATNTFYHFPKKYYAQEEPLHLHTDSTFKTE